ncbi:MAG: ABC transporter permease, partial [Gammaproteobacteria bacterium]
MFRDYLRGFWRGVLHNKVATFINVGGLALGLAVFFALSFYVDREFSWDAHWDGAERIYVPMPVQESSTGVSTLPSNFIPYVVGTSLQTLRPGDFEAYARVYPAFGTITVDDNDYPNRSISLVEPALLDMLQLETVEGSLDDALADPSSVAVNATSAKAYFGDTSPLGRTVTLQMQLGPRRDYTVRAVYRVPGPSTFATMPFLARLDETALPQPNTRLDLWQFAPPPTPPRPGEPPQQGQSPLYLGQYFKLRPGVDIQALERDFRSFMDEGRFTDTGNSKIRYVFRSIRDLHLQPSPFQPGDNVQRLLVYAAIGVLVLLISGCNFVMLATLRLADRMREVGIRKSVGGGAPQLMGQYLLDAFLHTLVASIFAIAFLALAFPKLAPMLE